MLENRKPKIIAIIPAYNEQNQIAGVLEAVSKVDLIDQVIVVNDGSKDRTSEIAGNFPVTLIDHKKNHGKGAALQSGINLVRKSDADILVFLDADLINLKSIHIKNLIDVLIENKNLLMTVGILKRSDNKDTTPEYSGQRAIRMEFFDQRLDFSMLGFGVELALTDRLKKIAKKIKVKETALRKTVIFPGVTHIAKEEKHGPLNGFGARMKMIGDISIAPLHLVLSDIENVLIDLDNFFQEAQTKRLAKREERKIRAIKRKLEKVEEKWEKKVRKNSF
jgi:glycosyltransferase involved in cell wall biosynthesis